MRRNISRPNRNRWTAMMALALTLGVTSLLSGCGSGGSGPDISGDGPGIIQSGNLTRSGAGGLSQDALILASRAATDIWIPTALATAIDNDLKTVRQKYPQLETVYARPANDLYSVLLILATDAPWRSAWEAGTLTTGDAAVDDLLSTYKAIRVEKIADFGGKKYFFTLHFEDPLNARNLANRLNAASSYIRSEGNANIGDGNQIVRETPANGVRIYTFSRGWGDCLSGCAYRRDFKVTMDAKGKMKLEESGDDPTLNPSSF